MIIVDPRYPCVAICGVILVGFGPTPFWKLEVGGFQKKVVASVNKLLAGGFKPIEKY